MQPVPPRPAAPSGIAATATVDGFKVSWGDPAIRVSHELRYRLASVGDWFDPVDIAAGTKVWEAMGLDAGADYELQLRAVALDGGTSRWEPSTPVRVSAGIRPGAPGAVSATDLRRDGIEVVWDAPADPGSGVSGYRVQWTDQDPVNGFAVQNEQQLPAGQTRYRIDITRLVKGAPYWVRVVAHNPVADSSPSEIATATATTPPGPVAELSAEADYRQLALRWAAPPDSGGTPVTGYQIRLPS